MSAVSFEPNHTFCTTGQFQRSQTELTSDGQQCNIIPVAYNVTPRTVESAGRQSRRGLQHIRNDGTAGDESWIILDKIVTTADSLPVSYRDVEATPQMGTKPPPPTPRGQLEHWALGNGKLMRLTQTRADWPST